MFPQGPLVIQLAPFWFFFEKFRKYSQLNKVHHRYQRPIRNGPDAWYIQGSGEKCFMKKTWRWKSHDTINDWDSEVVEERDASTLTGCVGLTVIWSGGYNRFFGEVSTNGLHGVPCQDVNPWSCLTAGQLSIFRLSYCTQQPVLATLHLIWATLHLFELSCTNYSSLGRYVFGSEISYNKAPPRLPGLAY
jgi:hypothetical protein